MRHSALFLLAILALCIPSRSQQNGSDETCDTVPFTRVGPHVMWEDPESFVVIFRAGMSIDADGAPTAYHPQDTGLDRLANGGSPGNWWGIATHNGDPDGNPVVQGDDDPAPGYFVSTTALQDRARDWLDQRRYVDAATVPYIVLPGHLPNVALGDLAAVVRPNTGATAFAIFADVGPPNHLGEGSIALADALGINSDPRRGGTEEPLIYIVFPGSGDGRPHSADVISAEAARRLQRWGGVERLLACFATKQASNVTGAP